MSITYDNSWLIILSTSLPNEIEIKESETLRKWGDQKCKLLMTKTISAVFVESNIKPVLYHSIDMII